MPALVAVSVKTLGKLIAVVAEATCLLVRKLPRFLCGTNPFKTIASFVCFMFLQNSRTVFENGCHHALTVLFPADMYLCDRHVLVMFERHVVRCVPVSCACARTGKCACCRPSGFSGIDDQGMDMHTGDGYGALASLTCGYCRCALGTS